MTEINKDIDKYLSQVKSYLPCRKADKTAILEDIRQAIFEFKENSGTENIDDIYNRFGTPEEIAKAYLSDAEPQNIKKAINTRKVLIAVGVAVVIVFAIFLLCTFIETYRQGHGTVTIDIETGTTILMIASKVLN